MKDYRRGTREYFLAQKIIHLKEALETANKILNDNDLFGVLPDTSVSFREANKFHKKVRTELEKIPKWIN